MPRIKAADPLDIGRNGLVTLNYVTLYKGPHGPPMSLTSFLTCSKFYQTIWLYVYPTERRYPVGYVFLNITRYVVHYISSHGKWFVLRLSPHVIYITYNVYWTPYKSFEATIPSHQLLVHTYSNSYLHLSPPHIAMLTLGQHLKVTSMYTLKLWF